MYKYIKGITVTSEYKMPSAEDIAQEYNLWSPLDKTTLVPNGTIVDFIIDSYIHSNNYKQSEYYYREQDGYTIRVYPEDFVKKVMSEFMRFLKSSNVQSDKDKVIDFYGIPFIYYEKPVQQAQIININDYKKRKGGK